MAGQDPKQSQSYAILEKSKYHPSHKSFFSLVSNEELSNKIIYEELKIHMWLYFFGPIVSRRLPYRRFFKGVFCWTLFSAATWGHQRAKILDGSYKAFSSSICYPNWFACYLVVLFSLNWFLNVLVLCILRYSISNRKESISKQIYLKKKYIPCKTLVCF